MARGRQSKLRLFLMLIGLWMVARFLLAIFYASPAPDYAKEAMQSADHPEDSGDSGEGKLLYYFITLLTLIV